SSDTGFGFVTRLTRTVNTRHDMKDRVAIQKFCAMADGKVWIAPNQPPAPSAAEKPSVNVAAASPARSPANAPCPVVLRQNIPSRKVANNGALTNPKTSCRKSMMLLDCAAQYAAPMESST